MVFSFRVHRSQDSFSVPENPYCQSPGRGRGDLIPPGYPPPRIGPRTATEAVGIGISRYPSDFRFRETVVPAGFVVFGPFRLRLFASFSR